MGQNDWNITMKWGIEDAPRVNFSPREKPVSGSIETISQTHKIAYFKKINNNSKKNV